MRHGVSYMGAMATVSEMQTRIAAIDAILAAGVSYVMVGDRQVAYNLKELRAERDALSRVVASATNGAFRRVVFKGGSAF